MTRRRHFVACALCAALAAAGLGASPAAAQGVGGGPGGGAGPQVTRTTLATTDYDERTGTLLAVVEIPAGGIVARHTHPGIESSYVIEGTSTLLVQGQPDRQLAPGGGFQIPPGVPHELRNGGAVSKLAVTYVVEKGKPLATPA